MKAINYISERICVAQSKKRGRGVFAVEAIEAGTTVEISPVIVMPAKDRPFIDKTLLHDYIFLWGKTEEQCCMALGYIPLYNHSYQSNCDYHMHFGKDLIAIVTVRDIAAGEELFINYNGEWNNEKPVWFEVK